jgi:hypothetical protein
MADIGLQTAATTTDPRPPRVWLPGQAHQVPPIETGVTRPVEAARETGPGAGAAVPQAAR